MVRVVMFTNTFAPLIGGIERSVAQFHNDLNQSGHFCRVVTPAFRQATVSRNGILRTASIKGIGEQGFSFRLPSISRIDRWMEAIEPNLVHAHQPFMLGDTAWRISQERRIPLVFTHHTLYERYARLLPLEDERASRLVLSLTTHFANRCDLCIAPTESVAELMRDRGIEAPIEVVPSGIDVERYSHGDAQATREQFTIPPDHRVFGYLGRVTHEKNMQFVADAASRILAATTHTIFLCAGEGDAVESVRKTIEKAGFGDRLRMAGILTGDAVPNAFKAMELFLFASRTDTQGLVLAEAMAASTPTIALDAPGARDCIRHNETGLLLPTDATPAEMADSTVNLLEDRPRLRQLQENTRASADDFSHSRCSQRLIEAYQNLLDSYSRAHLEDPGDEHSTWDHFLDRIEQEWTLITEKIDAGISAAGGR